jgi:hypothetical protein
VSDDYKPVTREDVTDLALLPKRFDLFAHEVRQSFELLTERLIPALTRIEEKLEDFGVRIARLERGQVDNTARITALEQAAKRRIKAARKK